MIPRQDAEELAKKLTRAAEDVSADYTEEDVIGEEDFSSQLCGRLKETLRDFETNTMVWQVRTAESEKGFARIRARTLHKVVEEPLFGADIVMTIEAVGSNFEVKKGFLAQAKRLEQGKRLNTRDYNQLKKQCRDMLAVTPASFVFLYSTTGVTVVSANAVVSQSKQDLWKLKIWDLFVLFLDFAICWVGDTRLQTTSRRSLDDLRVAFDANAAIEVAGKPKARKTATRRRRHIEV